jgi:N-methylhydantoinase A
MPDRLGLSDELPAQNSRQAYFGPSEGWIETTIVGRAELAEKPMEGPIIMEEYDATTVIPPGAKAHTDDWGNVIIERER